MPFSASAASSRAGKWLRWSWTKSRTISTRVVGRRQRIVAVRHTRGRALLAPLRIEERAVEPGDRVAHPRRRARDLDDLVVRHGEVAEQGIGEHFGEVDDGLLIGLAGQRPQVDLVDFGQTQQELRGDGRCLRSIRLR